MFIDFLRFAIEGIKKRRLRSLLTMIGIFIGIAAVVSLISLGQGLQNTIKEQFEMVGIDKIIIAPSGMAYGAFSSEKLTKDDVNIIKKSDGVEDVTEMFYTSGKIKFKEESKGTLIIGLPTDESASIITEMSGFKAEKGRFLKDGDKYKVVVGWRLWNNDFFEKSVGLRDKIEIDGVKVEVVGLLKKIGNPQDDSQIYLPIDTTRDIFENPDEVSGIYAQVKKGYNPEKVAENIRKNLRNFKDEEKGGESFQVKTFENYIDTFNNIFLIVQIILIGIAAISLLVGGIGIMNTMFMSVMERTREIGVMKAIGARNSHILGIFLIESGIYGLIGGAIGVFIGVSIAKIVQFAATHYMGSELLKASMSPVLIIGALLFSFIVGCLSGIAPSYRASKLKPVEALRYE
ncbi:ABC transporter permease [Candidatus Pacearchaeota archaeon]|nr:MAG: ABC transporter permease [Candidatus Pacearchaeota archaeon]